MNDLRTAAQQALEACEQRLPLKGQAAIIDELNNLRAALAQQDEPVQEPVAWLAPRIVDSYSRPDLGYETCSKSDYGAFPAYAAPPQRKLVPLTEEEIDKIFKHLCDTVGASCKTMARAVEKASWEKNNGQA